MSLFSIVCILYPTVALALPIADGTVGTQVNSSDLSAIEVTGGTLSGQNLFHSFFSFDVEPGEGVYFTSPVGVNHIFSRVTGGNQSLIDGVLGTSSLGTDLFLINPKGVVFGPNASLDVQGSFIMTTADEVHLGAEGIFSATEPSSDRLLSVQPSAFFFSGLVQPGEIINQTQVTRTSLVNPSLDMSGLQVPAGENLVFLGGPITLDGGELNALGGRIELAAISGSGAVSFDPASYDLTVPDTLLRDNIQLINGSSLNAAAAGDGNIALYGNDITLIESSRIDTGIASGLGADDIQGGDLIIDATGDVSVLNDSFISNEIEGTGQGGNITVFADALRVTSGSQIITNTSGNGDAGDVLIDVEEGVVVDGISEDQSVRSIISSRIKSRGVGNSGDIRIFAETLEITHGAGVVASNLGRSGDAGNVILQIQDDIIVDGSSEAGDFRSYIVSILGRRTQGTGGSVDISTHSLAVTDGGLITTSTLGEGDAGDVMIVAQGPVVLDGVSVNGEDFSEISSGVGAVNAPGGTITDAVGNGGDVTITANTLVVTNGAAVTANTFGQGDAGDLMLTAHEHMIFSGTSENEKWRSGALSRVERAATGNGGSIEIVTNTLSVSDRASISASTLGEGDAGDITIYAEDWVAVDGIGETPSIFVMTRLRSSIVSRAVTRMAGDSGSISIYANSLAVTDGGNVSVSSASSGNSGDIVIVVDEEVLLNAGNIAASSFPRGDVELDSRAGNLNITADRVYLENDSSLSAISEQVDGGNITLDLDTLLVLRDASTISASAGTEQTGGNGGNISITVPFIVAIPNEDSDITANAFSGAGGRVTILAQGVFGIQPRPELTPLSDITASSEEGVSGVIAINSLDTDFIENNLGELPIALINAETVLSESCIVREPTSGATLLLTRSSLADKPNESFSSAYPAGDIQTIGEANRPQPQLGHGMIEPAGIYQTASGRLVMARECL